MIIICNPICTMCIYSHAIIEFFTPHLLLSLSITLCKLASMDQFQLSANGKSVSNAFLTERKKIIINYCRHWNSVHIAPFLSNITPAIDSSSQTLTMLMREKIVAYCLLTKYADADIKSFNFGRGIKR